MKKNVKNLYSITYIRPYNQRKTYYQNANRNVATASVWGAEQAAEKIAQIIAQGFTIKCVFDGTGKFVEI